MPEESHKTPMTDQLPDNLRLLLVDDEANILRSLQRVLRKEPYELVMAGSGQAAIEVLENQRIDLAHPAQHRASPLALGDPDPAYRACRSELHHQGHQ